MLFKTNRKPLRDSTGHSSEKGEAEVGGIGQGGKRHGVHLLWDRMIECGRGEEDHSG